jgi:hypothetical protein
MPLEIHHITLSKEQLAGIPVQERNLFILLGHAANEVGVLAKLFHYCAGNHFEEPILEKAELTQAMLLGRLLTGKIYEFWKLMQNGYFGTGLSKTYRDILDEEARSTLEAMKRYFGQDNLIARVRNGHAFHYDVQQIEDGFRAVVEGEALDIFLSKSNANSLYAFSDTIAGRAMLEAICPADPANAMNLLIVETSRAVAWINAVTGGLMMKCLERYLGGDLYSLGAEVITLKDAPSSQTVSIPYFVQIPTREDA